MGIIDAVLPFLVVLSFLVFVHEWGHYIVARFYGVAIDVFSIGFGREIYGFHDKYGTRWRFSLIPLGGYVRFFGDDDAASLTKKSNLSQADIQKTFHGKTPFQRIMILFAGPFANLLAALGLLFLLFASYGESYTRPVISGLIEGGAAKEAGLQKGDTILALNNQEIEFFSDLGKHLELSKDTPILFRILRDNNEMEFRFLPRMTLAEGEVKPRLMIGVLGNEQGHRSLSLWGALQTSFIQTFSIFATITKGLGELISGARSMEQLGGPVQIAQLSKDSWQNGMESLIRWTAFISINLAIFNLLPLPPLDGGHILFTSIEAMRRRPLSDDFLFKSQMMGVLFVIGLFLYVTWNDTLRLWNG